MSIIEKIKKVQEEYKRYSEEYRNIQNRGNELSKIMLKLEGRFEALVEQGKEDGILNENGEPIKQHQPSEQ